ncbi:MAG: nucleotide exchange factor GrpE [Desulfobulbaceae bacterium]|nr:nucleotide exchange factor GrpE [Desulfobulbaceae bacterium]
MNENERGSSSTEEAAAPELTFEQYKKALDEMAAWKDKYIRLYAELENSKKRMARLYADQAQEQKQQILLEILPFVDNLERALENTSMDAGNSGLSHGVILILKGLMDMLEKHGVQPFPALERSFDPALHEALGVVSDSHVPPGTVVRVEQTGYTLKDKLLRPARVMVASE